MRAFILGLVLCAVPLATAQTATPQFVRANPDHPVGDWHEEGSTGGLIAQLSLDAHQDFQLNLLREFDAGADALIATLRGKQSEGIVALRGGGWTASLAEGRLTVRRGDETRVLTSLTRPSPTLGAKPPEGAIVLFDGTSFDGWSKKAGKDWLTSDGPPAWTLLPDGAMEVIPGADSLISDRQFGDCTLHVEFRTLGAPTNSGVYLQARYEVDINESYGRTDGNPSGSLGNCSPVKPSLRASRPALAWQTLDLEFKAPRFSSNGKKIAPARMTVLLNGVTLYNEQPLDAPKGAASRLGEAPLGPLLLQEHGAALQFRNIWLLPVSL